MNPSRRFIFYPESLFTALAILVAATLVCVIIMRTGAILELSSAPHQAARDRAPTIVGALYLPADGALHFAPSADPHASRLRISGLYRLVGTYMTISAGGIESPRAIISVNATGEQRILAVGDLLHDGAMVRRVLMESIVVSSAYGDERLFLNGSEPGISGDNVKNMESGGAGNSETSSGFLAALGGSRVSDNRWHFTRDGLLTYYKELRNDPARLLDVFDSMKPVRNAGNQITGYRLGIEGEADFFTAAGLREGDIVRAVNSMEMTNRRRAEALIEAFVRDNLNTLVLEVEREGGVQKLVYIIDPETTFD